MDRIPFNHLSLKRCSEGTTVLNNLSHAKNLRIAAMIAAELENSDSDNDEFDENDELEEIAAIYLQLGVGVDAPRQISQHITQRKVVSVNSYSDDECWRLLRFNRVDITRLIELLDMPLFFTSDNHTREFSFILVLHRMAYPGRLTDLEHEFGRDHTALRRCIGITVAWLDANH